MVKKRLGCGGGGGEILNCTAFHTFLNECEYEVRNCKVI